MNLIIVKKETEFNLRTLDKLSYGIGNLGFGVIFQSLSTFIMLYATVILGVPGRYVGLIMSLSVFWDAITDPIMGYISDVSNFKKFGRRHFYILFGSITVALFNYLLWIINTDLSSEWKIILLFLYVFLIKTGMTMYQTPYIALGVEMSKDYDERTTIQGFRVFFFLSGLAFPTVMGILLFFRPTEDYPIGQLNPAGYQLMGITTSLIMLLTGLVCYMMTKKVIPYLPKYIENEEKRSFKKLASMFSAAVSNRYFKYIFWGYLFVNISSALIGTLGLHVFTYTFFMTNTEIAITMGLFFAMTLISQPFWAKHSMKYDKKPSMQHSIIISLFGCIVLFIAVFARGIIIENPWILLPVFCAVGFGAGGLFLFPPSMVGDVIDVDQLDTEMRSEGVYFGAMTFGYKASQSVAIFLAGMSLDMVGFDPDLVIQTDNTAVMLGLILAIGSMIVLIAAYYSYEKYTLNKDKINDIQKRIYNKNI